MLNRTISASFYGKLQTYADFIQYGIKDQYFDLFEQWMQEALDTGQRVLSSSFSERFEMSSWTTFFFPVEDKILVGTWAPSRDEIGRRYPFIIYTTIHAPAIETVTRALNPLLFMTFWDRVYMVMQHAMTGVSKETLAEQLQSLSTQSLDTQVPLAFYNEFKRITYIHDFFQPYEHVFGPDYKLNVLKCFKANLMDFAPQERANIGYGFKIPIIDNIANSLVVATYFIELINSIGQQFIQKLYLFLTKNRSNQRDALYLFFKKPPAQIYLNFLDPNLDVDVIEDTNNVHYYNELNILSDSVVELVKQSAPLEVLTKREIEF